MSDSVWPHRRQPTRLPHTWDSPGKNTGVGCHFLLQCMKVKSQSEVAQSYTTLCDPMDCSLPGSSVHGIFQARVLEWGAIAFSRVLCRVFEIGNEKKKCRERGSVFSYGIPRNSWARWYFFPSVVRLLAIYQNLFPLLPRTQPELIFQLPLQFDVAKLYS